MPYKALIFGLDGMFPFMKQFYDKEIQRGTFEIVAYAEFKNNDFIMYNADGSLGEGDDWFDIDIAIISSYNQFYERRKILEANGFPRNQIIDGQIFRIPNLDFPRLLAENTIYATLTGDKFYANSYAIYPQVYSNKSRTQIITLGSKSYIEPWCRLIAASMFNISVGNYSCIARDLLLNTEASNDHRYNSVSAYSLTHLNWQVPAELRLPQEPAKILIGNDVWIGRGCILKSVNPDKPLIIGDGAVIASDSVVVKNVPPYAVVGGNPAKIIKYRFEPHIIEALQRIKWWDWSLDKIHDNFKYFNNIDKFIALHDK